MGNQKDRFIGLDVLRSMAILLVLLRHGQFLLEQQHKNTIVSFLVDRLDGVVIFFVLSGFLIGSILLKNASYSFKTLKVFFIRRWLRTLPAYGFVLILLLFLSPKFPVDSWKYGCFLQNLVSSKLAFFPESWSLSVEEWFYLSFLILLLFTALSFSKKTAYFIIIALFLIVPLTLTTLFYEHQSLINKAVLFRLDEIGWGMFAAGLKYYFPEKWQSFQWKSMLISGILLLVVLFIPNSFYQAEKLQTSKILAIIVALSLPFWTSIQLVKFKVLALIFRKISDWSYALYLVNLSLVQGFFLKLFSLNDYSSYVLFWLTSFAFAILLHYGLEKPILNWRNKQFQD